MKKLLFAANCALIAFLFSACKESNPSVDLTPVRTGDYDSLYILSSAEIAALSATPHVPLIEEFTGQDCNNCPSAHATLESFTGVNIVCLYPYVIPQATPPIGSVHDFRDSIPTQIGSIIYGGLLGVPCGGIDRIPAANGTIPASNRTLWAGNIDKEKAVASPVNITLTSVFDAAAQTAKITATVTYVEQVAIKQNLSVMITEDGMIDLQHFPDSVHTGYRFTNVFRDMVSTAPYGAPILDSMTTKAKGVMLKRVYAYKLKTTTPAINADSCHIVAFITNNNGTDKKVIQSAQIKLK